MEAIRVSINSCHSTSKYGPTDSSQPVKNRKCNKMSHILTSASIGEGHEMMKAIQFGHNIESGHQIQTVYSKLYENVTLTTDD